MTHLRSRDLPASLIALSIVVFPLARRPAELLFVAAVVAAAVAGNPSGDRSRGARLAVHGAFLGVATIWLVTRVVPPWGFGLHTLGSPGPYSVTLLTYVPFLWAFFFLSWHRFESRDFRIVCWAIVTAAMIQAVLVFGQLRLGWQGSWSWRPLSMPLFELNIRSGQIGRATGGHTNPNRLALSAMFGLVAATTLLLADRHHRRGSPRGRILRLWILVPALGGSAWALVQTGSRVTWSVAVLLLLCASMGLGRRARVVVLIAVTVTAALVVLSVRDLGPPTLAAQRMVPEVVWGRVSGTGTIEAGDDLSWRIGVWQCGLDLISERPLTGAGLGTFGPECENRSQLAFPRRDIAAGRINHAHNVFIQMASELGLPFTAFLSFWFLSILWGATQRLAHGSHGEARVLLAGFLGIVTGVLLVSQINLAVAGDHGLQVISWASLAILAAQLGATPSSQLLNRPRLL